MSKKDLVPFTSKTGSIAGKKSKRGKSFKGLIKEIFEKSKKSGGKLTLDNYMKSLVVNAMKGNGAIAKEINERLFGKLKDNLSVNQTNYILDKKEYADMRKKLIEVDDI